MSGAKSIRSLVLVLGDQLDPAAAAFDGFDAKRDIVWLAEVAAESEHVWTSKPRIAVFLSAMRHFRDGQRKLGRTVRYTALDDPGNTQSLPTELARAVAELQPERLVMTEAGEWRGQEMIARAAKAAGVRLEVRPDRHFFCTKADFAAHAEGRKMLRMEFFYREVRRRHGILLDARGEPEGGKWNFDHDNRGSFSKQYADGGIMASKPYAATGKYIQRMSNYCAGCRFDPAKATGSDACPFTTLYWDFLLRHEPRLAKNQRMALQVKNLARLKPAARAAIQQRAGEIKANSGAPPAAADELPKA